MTTKTTSTQGSVRKDKRVRSMMFFLLALSVVTGALWFAAAPASSEPQNHGAAVSALTQGIQCDQLCQDAFIQNGQLPPPVASSNQAVSVIIQPGKIQCDELCRDAFIQNGQLPPPSTD